METNQISDPDLFIFIFPVLFSCIAHAAAFAYQLIDKILLLLSHLIE